MNIFITGGTGFIGQALIKQLIKESHQVLAVVREEKKKETLRNLGVREVMTGDLTDHEFIKSLEKPIAEIETVIHLAAIPGEHHDIPWSEYKKQNVEATENLLALLKNKGKNFVFMSSISVYGAPEQKPADEKSPYQPITNYARSKIEAEKAVKSSGVNYLILRPGIVFGPGDSKGFMLRFLRLAKKFPRIIVGRGENRLPFVYINDLIEALAKLANTSFVNEEYILVTLQPKMKELSAAASKNLSLPEKKIIIPVFLTRLWASFFPLITQRNITLFTADTFFSSERLMKKINFKPDTSFEEGIKKTIQWYQENGYL